MRLCASGARRRAIVFESAYNLNGLNGPLSRKSDGPGASSELL